MYQKPILLVQLGPINLFWVTGVYYLWALKDKYSFILIVNDDYASSDKFKNIIKYVDVTHIHYQKKNTGFKLVFNLLKGYKKIFLKFKPSKILIYNSSYIDNQCLIDIALSENYLIEIFHYQNGRGTLNIQNNQFYINATEARVMYNKLTILRYYPKLAFKFATTKQQLRYYYYFKFIPLFLKGKFFKPPFNIFTGKENKYEAIVYKKIIKKYFVYLKIEAEHAIKIGASNCETIEHPLITSGDKLNNILYDRTKTKNQILIAPTYGFLEGLSVKGQSDKEIYQFVGQKYLNVINILLKKFPNYIIKFKPHPSDKDNHLWKSIISIISSKISNFEVINENINAESLILESRVVISDVSTILWWTIFFKDKIAISLDIFNFESGDEMQGYEPEIYYVDTLKKLENINFSSKSNNKKKISVLNFI